MSEEPDRKFSMVLEGKFYGHKDRKVNKKWLKSHIEMLLEKFEDIEVSEIKVVKINE